ncbi:hypothetical protein [Candidatus Velamenicoccus archaeovorus]|uniref:hypothetical protein n=1 Tax=Velamenicoccus archaeovorus TaxID=1930593 RepID=UPI000FFF4E6B|nr:hypothetical protein [Candidatus Velamenicoccus archaeovorus]
MFLEGRGVYLIFVYHYVEENSREDKIKTNISKKQRRWQYKQIDRGVVDNCNNFTCFGGFSMFKNSRPDYAMGCKIIF